MEFLRRPVTLVSFVFEIPANDFDERRNGFREDLELRGERTPKVGGLLLNTLSHHERSRDVELFEERGGANRFHVPSGSRGQWKVALVESHDHLRTDRKSTRLNSSHLGI